MGFERPQGAIQRTMHEIAKTQRFQDERILAAGGRAPSQDVLPDEPQRIPQQELERTRRMHPAQRRLDRRMMRAHQAVMGRDLAPHPVAPAGSRCDRLRRSGKFVGTRRESIGFAEGVRRHGVPPQVVLGRLPV
jgi:hypothetical protein